MSHDCMIDHEHGAFDLETIADLAGWFQATDLSAIVRTHKSFTHLVCMSLEGLELEHPTFKAAVRRIAEACNPHGKLARGSAETEAQIEEYWQLGCKVLNLPGNEVSTWLDGRKARAGRAHARLKSIWVPVD
jgi:2-keto-3-deoxy-L-rhamnonate aldolase RhmA